MTIRRWPLALILGLLLLAISASLALAPEKSASPQGDAQAGEAAPVKVLPADREQDRTGYIKGIYISYAALGNAELIQHVKDLLENTELNAVVMDFKSDRGQLAFPTRSPVAQEIGAAEGAVVQEPAAFLDWFTRRDVYLIARIPVFKDNLLAQAYPDWAVTDGQTGEIWRDPEGMAWVDPNTRGAWDYNTALAIEAARLGFDEVQFDYVRFPTDGNVGTAQFALANTQENRTAAIAGLLRQAQAALKPLKVKLAADIFGYAPWVEGDLGIGHQIEALAPYLDVISPMVYPSTFATGLPGEDERYGNAIAYPYEVVRKSTEHTLLRGRAVNPKLEVRPWLQDFPDYTFDGRTYTPDEIRRQMRGAHEGGAHGWLLWDPAVTYTRAALVSASPACTPNLRGKVAIIAYGDISAAGATDSRSPAELRADLETLLTADYYPVNLQDLVVARLDMVPAGKRPVVLTFDGSSAGHFALTARGAAEPDSAVGTLLAFHAEHPADWPLRATFFVRGDEPVFGDTDLAATKLRLLADWGMEIGLLPTAGDAGRALDQLSAAELVPAVSRSLAQVQALLPGQPIVSLAVPDKVSPKQLPQLQQAGWQAVVITTGGLAPSPLVSQFNPLRIPRLSVARLPQWLKTASAPGDYYCSTGESPMNAP